MGSVNFHARYNGDGSCELICTRCFHTVGIAFDTKSIRQLVNRHVCPHQNIVASEARTRSHTWLGHRYAFMDEILQFASGQGAARASVVLLVIVSVLYLFPTAIEFAALPVVNPWLATLLPGDLIGCVCLALASRRIRTGLLLYLALTAAETYMYVFHIVPLRSIPWITDLVPTMIAIVFVIRIAVKEAPSTRRLV